MFGQEFYPTPLAVIEQMNLDCYGKHCYEPHAGSGNIVNYLKNNGAKSVLATEINDKLRAILNGTCRIIGSDFFKIMADDISHVQLIAMNPPFSNAAKHILHAFDIAPEGCEIVSLCNWETMEKDYTQDRSRLKHLIAEYGESPINLGTVFSDAERVTATTEIGLIRLFKPVVSTSFDYEGFCLNEDDERQENGIMQYNEVRSVVNTYIAAVRCFSEFRNIGIKLNTLASSVGFKHCSGFSFNVSHNNNITTQEDFAKQLQKECWKHLFEKMNIKKWVTSGVMKEINTFIENRSKYPFSMRNIYRMFEIIAGTNGNTMKKAIIEAIDNLTMYTHENRHHVEGWKTNSGHLLNKKFIVNYMVEPSYESRHYTIKSSNNMEKIQDLMKALCFLTGKNYDDFPSLETIVRYGYKIKNKVTGAYLQNDYGTYKCAIGVDTLDEANRYIQLFDKKVISAEIEAYRPEYGELFEWAFFKVRGYKKGTMHFEFKSEYDWEVLNAAYAHAKGVSLPEKTKQKKTKQKI